MRSLSTSSEIKLYHQIHPAKLATDIAAGIAFLIFLWQHRFGPALLAGFAPPVIVSGAMMIWPPNLDKLRNSPLGKYISRYMTRTVEGIRLLTLLPMAWGAWTHHFWLITLGFATLLLAWCNGLIWPRSR